MARPAPSPETIPLPRITRLGSPARAFKTVREDCKQSTRSLVACYPGPAEELPGLFWIESDGLHEVVTFLADFFSTEDAYATLCRRAFEVLSERAPVAYGLALPYWGRNFERRQPAGRVADGYTLSIQGERVSALLSAPLVKLAGGTVALGGWSAAERENR